MKLELCQPPDWLFQEPVVYIVRDLESIFLPYDVIGRLLVHDKYFLM